MAAPAAVARENGKKGGRPVGSTSKPKISDHLTEEEVKNLVAVAKKKAEEGDTTMMKFLLEQIYGKAPQSIDLPAGSSGQLIVKWGNQEKL